MKFCSGIRAEEDGDEAAARVIGRLLDELVEERDHLSEVAFGMISERLSSLRVMLAGRGHEVRDDRRAEVEARIRRHVRRFAQDSGLDVKVIARALGWSPRYVQQVLRVAGTTPRDLIRRERLRLARIRLDSPEWAGSSIAQIGRASGFSSHSSFSTAFRQDFGITPREARGAFARPVGSA